MQFAIQAHKDSILKQGIVGIILAITILIIMIFIAAIAINFPSMQSLIWIPCLEIAAASWLPESVWSKLKFLRWLPLLSITVYSINCYYGFYYFKKAKKLSFKNIILIIFRSKKAFEKINKQMEHLYTLNLDDFFLNIKEESFRKVDEHKTTHLYDLKNHDNSFELPLNIKELQKLIIVGDITIFFGLNPDSDELSEEDFDTYCDYIGVIDNLNEKTYVGWNTEMFMTPYMSLEINDKLRTMLSAYSDETFSKIIN